MQILMHGSEFCAVLHVLILCLLRWEWHNFLAGNFISKFFFHRSHRVRPGWRTRFIVFLFESLFLMGVRAVVVFWCLGVDVSNLQSCILADRRRRPACRFYFPLWKNFYYFCGTCVRVWIRWGQWHDFDYERHPLFCAISSKKVKSITLGILGRVSSP
jgi:hypothetical protein